MIAAALLCANTLPAVAQEVRIVNAQSSSTADAIACERKPGAAPERRNGYAFIVGNSAYTQPGVPAVDYAINDANAICDYVVNTLGYSPHNICAAQCRSADAGKLVWPGWRRPKFRAHAAYRPQRGGLGGAGLLFRPRHAGG